MNPSQRVLARGRLERAFEEIAPLLMGPDAPTSAYEDWVARVKRALSLGLGDKHALFTEFEVLVQVHRASSGQFGLPGSFRSFEERVPVHQVLRRSKDLIEDAITLLAQASSEPDSPPQPLSAHAQPAPITISAAAPSSGGFTGDHPKALLSYAWESAAHKAWVRELASELRRQGIDIILDQWQVHPGDQLPEFMERAIRESEFVIAVCTPLYKEKSEGRKGGVGYEGNIMTAELFARNNQRKFIPALRSGDHATSLPGWMAGKSSLDLRGDGFGPEFDELVRTLRREREIAPPLGPPPIPSESAPTTTPPPAPSRPKNPVVSTTGPSPARLPTESGDQDEIRLVGIDEGRIGTPRMDGSRGSALYSVPVKLSRPPSHEWGELFVQVWNRPPQWTSMHRPGIASVRGDCIILDGTTLDEVARYHRDTLKLVVNRVNELLRESEQQSREVADREHRRREEHEEEARRRAKDIKFD